MRTISPSRGGSAGKTTQSWGTPARRGSPTRRKTCAKRTSRASTRAGRRRGGGCGPLSPSRRTTSRGAAPALGRPRLGARRGGPARGGRGGDGARFGCNRGPRRRVTRALAAGSARRRPGSFRFARGGRSSRRAPRGVVVLRGRDRRRDGRCGVVVSHGRRDKVVREANGWRSLDRAERGETARSRSWGRGTSCGDGRRGARSSGAGIAGRTGRAFSLTSRFEAIAGDAATGEVVALAREVGATTLARGSRREACGTASTDVLPRGRSAPSWPRGATSRSPSRGVSSAPRAPNGFASTAPRASAAMTFAREDGTLLVALHSEGEGRAWSSRPAPARRALDRRGDGRPGRKRARRRRRTRAYARFAGTRAAGVVWAAGAFGDRVRPARREPAD